MEELMSEEKNQKEKRIVTSFLIPKQEDEKIGVAGKKHSEQKWGILIESLKKYFGGYTTSNIVCEGEWYNEEDNKMVYDVSRRFEVDVMEKDLEKMVEFLKRVAVTFKQQCIRLVHEGEVEYIYIEDVAGIDEDEDIYNTQ